MDLIFQMVKFVLRFYDVRHSEVFYVPYNQHFEDKMLIFKNRSNEPLELVLPCISFNEFR
jgi:hypothetical protein